MTQEKCWGFTVYSQNAFYAISSRAWQMFFDPNETHEALRITKHSIIVHVWNKKSSNQHIKKKRNKTAYEIIASRNCPRVYRAAGNYF